MHFRSSVWSLVAVEAPVARAAGTRRHPSEGAWSGEPNCWSNRVLTASGEASSPDGTSSSPLSMRRGPPVSACGTRHSRRLPHVLRHRTLRRSSPTSRSGTITATDASLLPKPTATASHQCGVGTRTARRDLRYFRGTARRRGGPQRREREWLDTAPRRAGNWIPAGHRRVRSNHG